METPITLTGVTVDRLVSATILQLTGVGSTDFSPYVGRAATVVGSHARMTRRPADRLHRLPSVAAGATVTQDVTVTGANADIFAAHPRSSHPLHSGFLGLARCRSRPTPALPTPSVLVIQNPTGAAIDRPGESWFLGHR